ncbi:ABC1 family protein C21C3.03, mitochondrial isoform X2 [Beta vulgaris subsp. vulgaris]|uniref:ABC1 family protein C21C3.03, mitochondrial isoform X2 n=1 Tax=Beta vulgaris subsp. vulgaris TaxID=3555 RepID=UPI00053F54AA|nr:ABC1 family protein C21C3.03, mitochondrial isoform X2 [Beta vulgaris subsp. vulgaris]
MSSLAAGRVRRIIRAFLHEQKCSYSKLDLCSQYNLVSKTYAPRKFSESKYLFSTNGIQKMHSFSASFLVSHEAKVAWRRLFYMQTYGGQALSRISEAAAAVSLALSRYQLLAPSVLALLAGQFSCGHFEWTRAECLPVAGTLYNHAQSGHVYLTSIVFSLVETITIFLRAIYLAVIFSPCIVMAPFADSLGVEFREAWLRVLRCTLEKAGPAFIKWGQWAATRPDLFPQDICTELAQLHSQAPVHSFAFTKQTIEKAFGRKLGEIFENFDEEPVASGSVAQVYRATLKFRYPGHTMKPRLVAVKVRHPGVGEAIRRDFIIINVFAKVSNLIPTLKWLRLDESLQQFAVFMMSQVDLAREAAHLSRFIYNFRRWKDVSFPKPLYPLVHPAVLVETYEHGQSVLHYVDKLEGHGSIKTALASIGSHALLKMLLVDNFVHADMHPGNILVRIKERTPGTQLFESRPHVIFLDVGMTAELSKRDRMNIVEFFKAVALRDGHTAAQCTLQFSERQSCPNPGAFVEEVEKHFNIWRSPESCTLHAADCMQQLLELVRHHKVNIDGNICTVIVTTMVLEGWQRKLDPEYNVLDTLRAMLFKVDWAESLIYTIEGLVAP